MNHSRYAPTNTDKSGCAFNKHAWARARSHVHTRARLRASVREADDCSEWLARHALMRALTGPFLSTPLPSAPLESLVNKRGEG